MSNIWTDDCVYGEWAAGWWRAVLCLIVYIGVRSMGFARQLGDEQRGVTISASRAMFKVLRDLWVLMLTAWRELSNV